MPRVASIAIDLSQVTQAQELQWLLMNALDFPSWYGCNWNAFWDAVTGLVEMPETLVLTGWNAFALRLPEDAKLMNECLDDMKNQYPKWAPNVIYA